MLIEQRDRMLIEHPVSVLTAHSVEHPVSVLTVHSVEHPFPSILLTVHSVEHLKGMGWLSIL